MAERVEWASAKEVSVGLALEGTQIGEDTVEGEALVINADIVFVIEGSIYELRDFARDVALAVK